MSGFIDRNPDQMIKYSQDAITMIDEMNMILRKTESLLDSYARDLDGPSVKQISKLHDCCADYYKQIEAYRRIAEDIKRKGQKLKSVREGGY